MQQKSIFRTVNRRSSGSGLLVLCAATVLLGACSSSGTNHSAGASTQNSAGASTSGSGGTSNCVKTATANTQAALANVKIEAPASFDASSMKGKKFAVIAQTATVISRAPTHAQFCGYCGLHRVRAGLVG
jgi:hypothetical protein